MPDTTIAYTGNDLLGSWRAALDAIATVRGTWAWSAAGQQPVPKLTESDAFFLGRLIASAETDRAMEVIEAKSQSKKARAAWQAFGFAGEQESSWWPFGDDDEPARLVYEATVAPDDKALSEQRARALVADGNGYALWLNGAEAVPTTWEMVLDVAEEEFQRHADNFKDATTTARNYLPWALGIAGVAVLVGIGRSLLG
jgi:hypothetical protein